MTSIDNVLRIPVNDVKFWVAREFTLYDPVALDSI